MSAPANTTPAQPATAPAPAPVGAALAGSSPRSRILIAVTVVTSVGCGVAVASGAGRAVLVLLALVVAASLGYLAMHRVFTFALVLLTVRSTIDITNLQEGGPGTTSGIAATAISLVLIGVATLWVAAQRRNGDAVFTPLSLGGVVLVAAAVLSTFSSTRPFLTLSETARTTSAVAMLVLLVAVVRRRDDVRRTLVACYCSMIVPLLFAAGQVLTGGAAPNADGISRIVGTFRHPNAFGAYLAVLLVFGVAMLQVARGRHRAVLAVLVVCGFAALVATYSRGSWLATILGLVVLAIAQRRLAVLFLLATALGAAAMVPAVSVRLADLGEARSLTGTGGNSFVWRLDHWREMLQFASHNPATGIGMDMAQFVTQGGTLPHNDFVRMYVEAGWLGLLSLLALLTLLAVTAVRAVRDAADAEQLAVASGFAGSLTVVATIMMGGNVISAVVVLWYFFALAACALWVASSQRGPGPAPAAR